MIHDFSSSLLLYMPYHRLIHQQHQIFRIITFLLLFVLNGKQSNKKKKRDLQNELYQIRYQAMQMLEIKKLVDYNLRCI